MKKAILIIGLAILSSNCGIGRNIWFKNDDTNGDKKISYQEFENKLIVQQNLKDYAKLNDMSASEAVKTIFDKYDVDKSNFLSKKEFSQFLQKGW